MLYRWFEVLFRFGCFEFLVINLICDFVRRLIVFLLNSNYVIFECVIVMIKIKIEKVVLFNEMNYLLYIYVLMWYFFYFG